MNRNLPLTLAASAIAVALTWVTIAYPALSTAVISVIMAVFVLTRVHGWWRRAYVVTIVAMFAGASHFEVLSTVGSIGKILALALLTLATLITTTGKRAQFSNRLHKLTVGGLWFTAGLALISVLWSTGRSETVTQALTFTAFVLILHKTSTTRWIDKTILNGDISATYWASFTVLILGAVMSAAGVPGVISDVSGRHLGVLNNPNLLGMIAAITFAIGVGLALYRRSPILWASLLVPLSQVLLSQSRTAILAVAVGLLWVVVRSGAVKATVVGFLIATSAVTASAFQINPFGDAFSRFGERHGGDVLNSRTDAWSDVFTYLQANPFGAGWAATSGALDDLNAQGITSGLSSIHNSYLQLMFELGWAGTIPALLSAILMITVALRVPLSGISGGLAAVAVAGSLIHLTESAIFGIGQPYPYLFWFAIMAALVNMRSEPPYEDRECREPHEVPRQLARAHR